MNFEIRDGRLHLAGYVNAVERDSKVIMTARGRCVEQVAAGAFAASMADGHEIRMMLDHKRNIGTTTDGTLSLKEDNIGLYAEASTDDEELMMLAGKGELRGWSFGFVAKDDEIEERSGKEPRRRVKALDLQEVSILSVMPAYNGTSIECRSYDECALPEDVDIVDDGVDDGTVEDVDTVDTSAVDELRAYAKLMKMKGYILRKREEQRALEMRYNHYHDPVNGRFASGRGGGEGLRYSFGRGKGSEIVGASSSLTPTSETVGDVLRRVTQETGRKGRQQVQIGNKTYHKAGTNAGWKEGSFEDDAAGRKHDAERTGIIQYNFAKQGLDSVKGSQWEKTWDMMSTSEKERYKRTNANSIKVSSYTSHHYNPKGEKTLGQQSLF
jgi:hypothetical protein